MTIQILRRFIFVTLPCYLLQNFCYIFQYRLQLNKICSPSFMNKKKGVDAFLVKTFQIISEHPISPLLHIMLLMFLHCCPQQNIFNKVYYEGSARPEVRGTAEPHGGAYPP